MSQPRGFGLNGKSIYMNVCKPEIVECNFVIDSTNGNGLGIRSLKSNGYIQNVFMNTSAPLVGSGNPNPLAGFIMVQFNNNFNKYLGGFSGFVSYVQTSTKIDNSVLVVGQAYVITTLGDASAADWLAIGVPAGVVPAVGVSFIATAIGVPGEANVSTSRVMLPKQSGIQSMEVIGNANLMNNSNISVNGGQIVIAQFLGPTDAATTTPIPKAPLDGSVCGMSFWFDGSSVSVDGL